ncbi:MAG: hypothetical protein ABW131_07420 [Candidatus Sedimenticola sp. 6PFRAG5]
MTTPFDKAQQWQDQYDSLRADRLNLKAAMDSFVDSYAGEEVEKVDAYAQAKMLRLQIEYQLN